IYRPPRALASARSLRFVLLTFANVPGTRHLELEDDAAGGDAAIVSLEDAQPWAGAGLQGVGGGEREHDPTHLARGDRQADGGPRMGQPPRIADLRRADAHLDVTQAVTRCSRPEDGARVAEDLGDLSIAFADHDPPTIDEDVFGLRSRRPQLSLWIDRLDDQRHGRLRERLTLVDDDLNESGATPGATDHKGELDPLFQVERNRRIGEVALADVVVAPEVRAVGAGVGVGRDVARRDTARGVIIVGPNFGQQARVPGGLIGNLRGGPDDRSQDLLEAAGKVRRRRLAEVEVTERQRRIPVGFVPILGIAKFGARKSDERWVVADHHREADRARG